MPAKTASRRRSNKRCFQDIKYSVHYPEENPDGALEDVTKTLAHIGVFDGIDNKKD